MENQNNQSQYRFLIAAVLSMVVLFGWSYFFSPPKPATDNANTAANSNTAPVAAQATPAPAAAGPARTSTRDRIASTPDTTPNRTITIRSPLYEVTLDSKGARRDKLDNSKEQVAEGRASGLRRRLERQRTKSRCS